MEHRSELEKYVLFVLLFDNFGGGVDMTLEQMNNVFSVQSDYLKRLVVENYSFLGHKKIDVFNILGENNLDPDLREMFVLRFMNDFDESKKEFVQRYGSIRECIYLWIAGLGDVM